MPRGTEVPATVRAVYDATASVLNSSSSGRVTIARLGALLPDGLLDAGTQRRLDDITARASEPIAAKTIQRELRNAWNQDPGKVLDDLDDEPLATHAAAQVHRGVLDGDPVAVKVRRPGLERSAHTDLSLLDTIAPALGRLLGTADAGGLLREARERILDEMDFEYEADGQRQAARALRGMDGIRIPAVRTELCAPEVMVSELLEGPTLADPAASVADPAGLARTLLEVHLTYVLRAGRAPCDPRPSHVVLCADGTVGLLGMGVARPVHARRQQWLLDGLEALRAGDAAALDAAARHLQLLPEGEAPEWMGLAVRLLGEPLAGPAPLDAAAVRGFVDRAGESLSELSQLADRVTLEPADLWPLRGLVQLILVLAHLGVTEDWVALATSAGREPA